MATGKQSDDGLVSLRCDDLDAALAFYTAELGFRLDMMMPADAPRVAVMSGFGVSLRLEQSSASGVRDTQLGGVPVNPIHALAVDGGIGAMPEINAPIIKRADGDSEWSAGRAGMAYRDLISDRVGGRVIASQIRIEHGGPVDDYVHYHMVALQLIYCRRGWVRVVYQDQGEPFVMQPGDCVLQPPTIRHRVLESSAGLEVIELGIPAEHETWRDHELSLPTANVDAQRNFGGQRFIRHIAADASWQRGEGHAGMIRDIGIGAATNGIASARVLRLDGSFETLASLSIAAAAFGFLFVLDGAVQLSALGEQSITLSTDDACVLASDRGYSLSAAASAELLEIRIPSL